MVPPGYYYNGTVMLKCAPGSYRADWKPKEEATACISCGDGVKAATTDQIKRWNTSDEYISWMEPVTSSSDDCCKFILKLTPGFHSVTFTMAFTHSHTGSLACCDTS